MEHTPKDNLEQANLTSEVNVNVLPHALDLEKSVLGALMTDTTALIGCMDKMHRGLFYLRENQLVFDAIYNLYEHLQAVDIVTVVEELRKEGNLEQAGGALYVSQLTSNVVSAAHTLTHIAILTEKYIQREVIRTANNMMKDAYSESCDPVILLDTAWENIRNVYNLLPQREAVTMDEALNETIESWEKENLGILSGFEGFDRIMGGFQPGTLTILASRPDEGEKSFALCVARNVAMDYRRPIVFFSTETKRKELVIRILSQETEIPIQKLRDGTSALNPQQRDILRAKIKELRKAPLFIDDVTIDIFKLRNRCRKLCYQYGIQMIFIDSLALIRLSQSENKNVDREQEVRIISQQLKEMAKELNVPVLITAYLKPKAEYRSENTPWLQDIREFSALEENIDNVIAIRRKRYQGMLQNEKGNSTSNQAVLHIMKNCNGKIGTVDLHFL